jgi:hypothetical protein
MTNNIMDYNFNIGYIIWICCIAGRLSGNVIMSGKVLLNGKKRRLDYGVVVSN